MIIDFEKLTPQALEKFNDGTGTTNARMYVDENNRIMKATLEPGSSIGLHRHEINCEFLYVISGKGKACIDGVYEDVSEGMVHFCPKGSEHTLMNDSDKTLEFVCFVPKV
jgi:quercetin dioxygenase-like cupin family protein